MGLWSAHTTVNSGVCVTVVCTHNSEFRCLWDSNLHTKTVNSGVCGTVICTHNSEFRCSWDGGLHTQQ